MLVSIRIDGEGIDVCYGRYDMPIIPSAGEYIFLSDEHFEENNEGPLLCRVESIEHCLTGQPPLLWCEIEYYLKRTVLPQGVLEQLGFKVDYTGHEEE